MSIAEKLTTIAENQQKVYNKGGLDVSPQETVSGEAIRITDISPIEHNMAVSVRGKNLFNVNELVLGSLNSDGSFAQHTSRGVSEYIWLKKGTYTFSKSANLTSYSKAYCYDADKSRSVSLWNHKNNTQVFTLAQDCYIRIAFDDALTDVQNAEVQVEEGTTATSYVPYIEDLSNVKLYKQGNNLISPYTLYEGARDYLEGIDEETGRKYIRFRDSLRLTHTVNFKENTQYTVSAYVKLETLNTANDLGSCWFAFWYSDGTFRLANVERVNTDWVFISQTSDAGKTIVQIGLYEKNYVNYVYVDVDTFMLEEGTSPTEYEPYIEPIVYDVSANGTVEGVNSIYPNTTLYTDTNGAVVDCTYYQDGRKVKENLTDMILSLGGVINE